MGRKIALTDEEAAKIRAALEEAPYSTCVCQGRHALGTATERAGCDVYVDVVGGYARSLRLAGREALRLVPSGPADASYAIMRGYDLGAAARTKIAAILAPIPGGWRRSNEIRTLASTFFLEGVREARNEEGGHRNRDVVMALVAGFRSGIGGEEVE